MNQLSAATTTKTAATWLTTVDDGRGRVYVGEVRNGRYNGVGRLRTARGTYVGEFRDGKRCGKGTIFHSDGDVYEGLWSNDVYGGEGIYRYENGILYVGDFVGGQACGRGTMTWPDGSWFEGEWKANAKHGKGRGGSLKHGFTFDGLYANDFRLQGDVKWKDGASFIGEFNEEMEAKGVWISADRGFIVVGEWLDYSAMVEGKKGTLTRYSKLVGEGNLEYLRDTELHLHSSNGSDNTTTLLFGYWSEGLFKGAKVFVDKGLVLLTDEAKDSDNSCTTQPTSREWYSKGMKGDWNEGRFKPADPSDNDGSVVNSTT